MKIIFFGTPEFAVPSLKTLIDSKYDIVGVVCQPDRPKGRGRRLTLPPTKVVATQNQIQVLQPEKIKTGDFFSELEKLRADLICVTAYGKIIPKNILELPKHGCINIHASLLPKYRGAAPINWAIINGEKTTGVTTMQMDEGMDTGDMLLKEESQIDDNETSIEISEKLSQIGAELLIETIKLLENGKLEPITQNEDEATYAPMLKKEIGKIDWNQSAEDINNLIRGTQPWPGAFTKLSNKTLKIFKAHISNDQGKPGLVLQSEPGVLKIGTGNGSLDILELQLEGSRKIKVEDFLRGNKIEVGNMLDN